MSRLIDYLILETKICSHLHLKYSQIRTPFNYLLMNMVFAELIIACFGLPVDFTASWTYGWKMGKQLCIATGFILTTTGNKT